MGEQESFSSSNSNPVYIVIMRNSRGKFFVYVAVLGVLCFIVFLLSSTHTSLKELESVNEKCQQQRDSLSAQLQVVYEHKNRLEKSLQQEKTEHRRTKEENEKQLNQLHQLENKLQEEKEKTQKLEAQVTQLKTSYSELEEEKGQSENALTEQLKTVQAQKDKEIEKLQNHISELLTEKDKLEVSNSAKVLTVQQQSSELNFCHLQHDQTKTELVKCQEQMQKNLANAEDGHLISKTVTTVKKDENENMVKVINDNPVPQIQTDLKAGGLKEEHLENKSSVQPPTEKKVLSKPHILPSNNAADGVLPKPDEKIEDVDAAVEVPEVKKGEQDPKLIHISQRDIENKIDILHDEKRENLDIKPLQKEQENHPQVLPPNNFDIGEKDDHAAERGEYGQQYGLPDARQQVEIPVFNSKHSAKRKNLMPLPQQVNNNDIAAQMQDMMNKSPGDVNNFDDQNGIHMPQQRFGAIDDKIREFKNADGLLHRGGDANNVMDDKNYEEDDDDRENDDDQGNGVAPDMKGIQVLQDNDFDDQDNQENIDNAKEEGVVIAPK